MSERQHPIEGQNGFAVVQDSSEYGFAWSVQLPHQCDAFLASYGDSHDDALAKLDAFIAEAQAARAKLVELAEEP